MDTFTNFAYGSNMSAPRVRQRAPSARLRGIGRLEGHALRWHKRGRDGSGKCDAEATGTDSDVVWGVLFEIDRSEKHRLDEAEGLHHGYDEKEVGITTGLGAVEALMYYATDIAPALRPFHWYKAFVVAGARQHGLPEPYIRNLEMVQSVPDPDTSRAAINSDIGRGEPGATRVGDEFDLSRFTSAQDGVYDRALAELRDGHKQTHWMWFVFPQLDGLGHSTTAKRYSIKNIEEATHYLNHPVLGRRLLECTQAVCAIEGRSVSEIFGYPDDLKFKSSMTLFARLKDPGSVFDRALDKYFHGRQDNMTLQLLERRR